MDELQLDVPLVTDSNGQVSTDPKQVVEERLGRLKVQTRPPSRGQLLCNLQAESVSSVENVLQVKLLKKCHVFNSLDAAMCYSDSRLQLLKLKMRTTFLYFCRISLALAFFHLTSVL